MKHIKQEVMKKQLEQAGPITDANRVLPGESFEAYLKRMAAQRALKAVSRG